METWARVHRCDGTLPLQNQTVYLRSFFLLKRALLQATRLFTCFFGVMGISVGALSLGVFIDEAQKFRARRKQRTREVNFAYHFSGHYADAQAKFDEAPVEGANENAANGSARSSCCKTLCASIAEGEVVGAFVAMTIWSFVGVGFFILEKTQLRDPPEDCSFIDAFYFTIITSTTIGYGDESPASTAGRLLSVIYLPLTTVFFGNLVGALASKVFEAEEKLNAELVHRQFGTELTAEELRMICKVHENGRGMTCTYHDYVLAMMVKLGKIDQDDIDSCRAHFQQLDKDGDGLLTVKDLSREERADFDSGHGIHHTSSHRMVAP
eukprot:COSAG02_NODE_199_length_29529_cov_32.558289_3_plen_324_part_00